MECFAREGMVGAMRDARLAARLTRMIHHGATENMKRTMKRKNYSR